MTNQQEATEKATGLMEQVENLPASAYYWGALGAIGVSALLMLLGRKNASIFFGLWPPTIAMLGLFNKQLHPSQEARSSGSLIGMNTDQVKDFASQAAQTAREMAGAAQPHNNA